MLIDNPEIYFASNYLESKGKKVISFKVIQKNIAAGAVDLDITSGQQIFYGYAVAPAADFSFKNTFEGATSFALASVGFGNSILADKVSSVAGSYIIGYLIDWE